VATAWAVGAESDRDDTIDVATLGLTISATLVRTTSAAERRKSPL